MDTGNSVLINLSVMPWALAEGCWEGMLVFGRGERRIIACVGWAPPYPHSTPLHIKRSSGIDPLGNERRFS